MLHVETFPLPAEILDHRPPHLWLDGIIDATPGDSAQGFWLPGDEHFDGHFDDMPILPGVKIVEALAQLTPIRYCWSWAQQNLEFSKGLEKLTFLIP